MSPSLVQRGILLISQPATRTQRLGQVRILWASGGHERSGASLLCFTKARCTQMQARNTRGNQSSIQRCRLSSESRQAWSQRRHRVRVQAASIWTSAPSPSQLVSSRLNLKHRVLNIKPDLFPQFLLSQDRSKHHTSTQPALDWVASIECCLYLITESS